MAAGVATSLPSGTTFLSATAIMCSPIPPPTPAQRRDGFPANPMGSEAV